MTLPAPDSDLYTVDEFYDLVQDGQKADLLEGVIYLASPDTKENDDLGGFIYFLLRGYSRSKDLGHVSGSRFAYRLGEYGAPEPDVAFVHRDRVDQVITRREGLGPPDVAVEVVSRDSRNRDYNEKKSTYEDSGVKEYWILDPLVRRAEFRRLHEGRYQLVPLEHNRIFRSEAVPGFWLDVEWLFGPESPNDLECLHRILAGPWKPT